jgi:hypothetical protein
LVGEMCGMRLIAEAELRILIRSSFYIKGVVFRIVEYKIYKVIIYILYIYVCVCVCEFDKRIVYYIYYIIYYSLIEYGT